MSAGSTSYPAPMAESPPRDARRGSRSALVRPRPPSLEAGPSTASSSANKLASEKDKRPAAKRARKAVNCDPCRTNKLKCDRNRPCSSCELRGTVAQCYQDGRPQDAAHIIREDPVQELAKIRKSLSSIEQYIHRNGGLAVSSPDFESSTSLEMFSFPTLANNDIKPAPTPPLTASAGPGSLGRRSGGLYNGPTSDSTHLIGNEVFDSDASTEERDKAPEPIDYDADVLHQMPQGETVNAMLDYYFAHGRYVYRHVWEPAFRAQWDDYSNGRSSDELVLATCCMLLALSTGFMQDHHPLKLAVTSLYGPNCGQALSDLAMLAESRYKGKHHSLEYLEYLLTKAHYLLFTTQRGEEIWAARAQMVSLATAMGLHRDPSQWSIAPEVAERRRWLWWYILCYERWQAFLLGRPLCIANHHFDTQLPSPQFEPAGEADGPGSSYVAALALFKLALIVGGVVDDALSLRPVPYAHIQAHDRAIVEWMEGLPRAWELSEDEIAAGLQSDDLTARRNVVHALCLRLCCYHVRLTLHRPYASRPATPLVGAGLSAEEVSPSAEIAISSAERLLSLANQYRKHAADAHPRAVPGHLAFVPFQVFSTAMFTSFQLSAAPMGPHAERHRLNIARAMEALHNTPAHVPGGKIAAQAIQILDAVAVLWSDKFVKMKAGLAKESKKQGVLARVRTLAFPFHSSVPATMPPASKPSARPSSAASAPAPMSAPLADSAVFGSQGTLMPDMSYSGRTPLLVTTQVTPNPAFSSGPGQPQLSVQVPAQPLPADPYSAEPSSAASQWSQRLHDTPPQHGQARRMSMPGPEYWAAATGAPYPPVQHMPPSATVPLHAASFPAPDPLGFFTASASMPSGSVSGPNPGMLPWGASMGIDSNEWTAFMQTMGPGAPQPFLPHQPMPAVPPQPYGMHRAPPPPPGANGGPPPNTDSSL